MRTYHAVIRAEQLGAIQCGEIGTLIESGICDGAPEGMTEGECRYNSVQGRKRSYGWNQCTSGRNPSSHILVGELDSLDLSFMIREVCYVEYIAWF